MIVRGGAPIYVQLREDLRERIQRRQWKVGERLPTERELCQTYNVSRHTLRQAVDGLGNEGLIERRQGSGSFVAAPKVEQHIGRLTAFTAEMLRMGMRPSLRVIEQETLAASAAVAQRLEIPAGEEVYRLVRLRLVNGEPLMIERSFLPARLCPGLLDLDLSVNLLHNLFADRYGLPFARQQKWVEPILADEYAALHLDIPVGAPALRIERLTLSDRDQPLELREIVVRGDRCRYFIEVSRP